MAKRTLTANHLRPKPAEGALTPAAPPAAATTHHATVGDPLRVLHVGSELAPLVKTGGLADVLGSLPPALVRAGVDARACVPGYRKAIAEALQRGMSWLATPLTIEAAGIDHKVGVGVLTLDGATVYLIACNELFDRDGIYGPGSNQEYEDNVRRYAVFCKAALALPGLIGWKPHVIHCHDWQTGLLPALHQRGFLRSLPATRTVLTIHNLAFQGACDPANMRLSGLDPWLYNPMHLEHFGRLNLLKSGIVFADRITTVSRRYAQEIQTLEFGYTLDAVVAHHRYKLDGITNGIDPIEWNPALDRHIAYGYSAQDLSGKRRCREALRQECGLRQVDRACLATVVSRLTDQKGIDLIIDSVSPFIASGRLQLTVLGSGDLYLENRLHQLQAKHPGMVFVWFGYNEALAHRFIAGADLFLMPSRFEPCGLTQMYAKRYGTLPLVRYTGGLADTVTDVTTGSGDGFTFGPPDTGHFSAVLDRACGLFEHYPQDWQRAIQRAMTADHSWAHAARDYVRLYQDMTTPG